MHQSMITAALAVLATMPLVSAGLYPKSSGVMEIMGKDFDRLVKNSANSSVC